MLHKQTPTCELTSHVQVDGLHTKVHTHTHTYPMQTRTYLQQPYIIIICTFMFPRNLETCTNFFKFGYMFVNDLSANLLWENSEVELKIALLKEACGYPRWCCCVADTFNLTRFLGVSVRMPFILRSYYVCFTLILRFLTDSEMSRHVRERL